MAVLAATVMAGGCTRTGLLDAADDAEAGDAAESDAMSTPDTIVAPDIGGPDDVPTELIDTGPPCSAPPEPVRDLRASDATEARFVVLDWAPDDDATVWRWQRDGGPPVDVLSPVALDANAPAPPLPSAPEVTDDGSDAAGVALQWVLAPSDSGALADYTVQAGNACGWSQPVSTQGRRAPWPVLGYEVEVSDGRSLSVSGPAIIDPDAPAPAIDAGRVSASDGLYDRIVRLQATDPTLRDGEPLTYRIRAVTEAGPGAWSTPLQARRLAAAWSIDWLRLPDPGADVTTELQVGGGVEYDDRDAPADGSPRTYAARFRLEGSDITAQSLPATGSRATRGFGSACTTDTDCRTLRCSRNRCVNSDEQVVPPGRFTMGSPPDEPGRTAYPPSAVLDETAHPVRLTGPVAFAEREVTQAQWQELMGANPAFQSECGPDCPVERITWWAALDYANRRSRSEGWLPCYELPPAEECTNVDLSSTLACGADRTPALQAGAATVYDCEGYRLPTEAEWEWAYRAGTTEAFYNGPITSPGSSPVDPALDAIGWYVGNRAGTARQRLGGLKQPNAWLLYDMAGNVAEWVWDFLGDYPTDGIERSDPAEPPAVLELPIGGPFRSHRGGHHGSGAAACRAAARAGLASGSTSALVGLRLVRTLPPSP